jgi:hypothetical protein
MPKKNKPLPKPPSTPFGRKKSFEEPRDDEPLMADQMAMAMSQGKLEEFLERELPDSDHARKLTEMMMGMAGMMPSGGPPPQGGKVKASKKKKDPSPPAPDEVVSAAASGDVGSLVDLLKKEHKRRHGITDEGEKEKKKKTGAPKQDPAVVEKEIIDQLIAIAADNSLSLDWIFFRALKRYIQDYQKTGNL